MNFLQTFNQTRKRLKQRATWYSLLVVLMLFGFFLEAFMHNFNLVYITLFFVFGLAMSASPLGILNIGNIQVIQKSCDRLFANEESFCHFQCHNPSTFESYALVLHCLEQSTSIVRIPAQKTHLAKLPFFPTKRGELHIEKCTLQSLFPLYTIRFILPISCDIKRVVYPQPKGISLQEYLSKRKTTFGDEQDFDGIRADVATHNVARMHWPSVAKGETAIKIFDYELPQDALYFDFNTSGKDDESRLSQLTLWALECEQKALDFKIFLPKETLNSQRMATDEILNKLALY
ncbi:MAG: hypothetical protein U9O24_05055 [Campylobacterota bacterium]|nr:hypothetical protein [Campylobacterota bacterium]